MLHIGLEGVTNPSTSGGTGNFKIRTLSNGFLQDDNEIYPAIGIADAPVDFSSVSLSYDGNAWVRYRPQYRLVIVSSVVITAGSWVRVTFPSDYIVPTTGLSCTYQEGSLDLPCTAASDSSLILEATGLPYIASGSTVTILMSGV